MMKYPTGTKLIVTDALTWENWYSYGSEVTVIFEGSERSGEIFVENNLGQRFWLYKSQVTHKEMK